MCGEKRKQKKKKATRVNVLVSGRRPVVEFTIAVHERRRSPESLAGLPPSASRGDDLLTRPESRAGERRTESRVGPLPLRHAIITLRRHRLIHPGLPFSRAKPRRFPLCRYTVFFCFYLSHLICPRVSDSALCPPPPPSFRPSVNNNRYYRRTS